MGALANSHHQCVGRQIVKMLIVVVVMFAIFWLPLQTFSLIMFIWPSVRQVDYASTSYNIFVGTYFTFHWMSMAHSCLNPLIYCFMNPKFRKDLRDLICGLRWAGCEDGQLFQRRHCFDSYSTTTRTHHYLLHQKKKQRQQQDQFANSVRMKLISLNGTDKMNGQPERASGQKEGDNQESSKRASGSLGVPPIPRRRLSVQENCTTNHSNSNSNNESNSNSNGANVELDDHVSPQKTSALGGEPMARPLSGSPYIGREASLEAVRSCETPVRDRI